VLANNKIAVITSGSMRYAVRNPAEWFFVTPTVFVPTDDNDTRPSNTIRYQYEVDSKSSPPGTYTLSQSDITAGVATLPQVKLP
jgi:hypothetical protein